MVEKEVSMKRKEAFNGVRRKRRCRRCLLFSCPQRKRADDSFYTIMFNHHCVL